MINYAKFKMSNPNQTPSQTSETTPPPPKRSARNSTPDPAPDPALMAMAALQQAMEVLQDSRKTIQEANELNARMLEREKPLLDFHEAIEGTTDNDMRIWWDVRIIRGRNTPFTQSTGTSYLPGLLSDKLRQHALATIQQEINDKIGAPIGSAFMEESERVTIANTSRIANRPLVDHGLDGPELLPAPEADGGSSQLLTVARQHEEETAKNADAYVPADDEEDDDA